MHRNSDSVITEPYPNFSGSQDIDFPQKTKECNHVSRPNHRLVTLVEGAPKIQVEQMVISP